MDFHSGLFVVHPAGRIYKYIVNLIVTSGAQYNSARFLEINF